MPAARGYFPAPLDDVYIHFDFARALATGHPCEWIPGNGYSSGQTSPLYVVVLALGFLVGFRDRWIGLFAALVAVIAITTFVRSVQRIVQPLPRSLTWLLPVLLLSVGLVDWTLFSGMEVAVFVGVLGATLEALVRARAPIEKRGGHTRESAQWRLGCWGAALVLLRPEAVVLVATFSVVAARGVGRRSGLRAIARAAIPGALATLLIATANWLFTGEAQSAGAVLKLITSNPYLPPEAKAYAYIENLVIFALQAVRTELGFAGWGLVGLSAAGLFSRRRRSLVGACLAGATGWIFIVAINGSARYHNFRYYVPALVLLLVAASAGAAALAHVLGRTRGTAIVGILVLGTTLVAGTRIPEQVRHFKKATSNIRDQQFEVAARLSKLLGPGQQVLLNDAGVVPFVTGRRAIDAYGLGGYQRMPFARASVQGDASIVELIERLPTTERPPFAALYPHWFPNLTARFGIEIDRVVLADNLICGGPAQVLYRTDWSALDTPHREAEHLVDELDVADVISEQQHRYVSPAPYGGWTTLEILQDPLGTRRFDGGRIIPEGKSESFLLTTQMPKDTHLRIWVRIDDSSDPIRLRAGHGAIDLVSSPKQPGGWRSATAAFHGSTGDVLRLEATGHGYRNYHVWIYREL